jgi:enoyl-CoA hydratase
MYLENFETILIERRGKAVYATLNRPEMRNAVNGTLDTELMRLMWEVDLDPDCDVLVITGAGKAFSAGGDIDHLRASQDFNLFHKGIRQGKKILHAMLSCEKPIIARVNGDAVGLGATLALFSDIVVADETARFADPHVNIGLAAGDGGAIVWPLMIGYARAKRFLLSGDMITGREAADMGLIAFAVPGAELDATVDKWVRKFTENSPTWAVRYTKTIVNLGLLQQMNLMVDSGYAYEMLSSRTSDHDEAISAFQAKRKPSFTGKA